MASTNKQHHHLNYLKTNLNTLPLEKRIQLIEDKQQISDTLYRYAAGLDSQDWVLWRNCFTDKVVFDMRSIMPWWRNTERDKRRATSADKNVASIKIQFAGLSNTQHLLGNHRYIELDVNYEDGTGTARVISTMRAEHWCPEAGEGKDRYTMLGYYDDRLIRVPETGEWKLCEVQLNVTRVEGNPEVMKLATKIGKLKSKTLPNTGGKNAWNIRNGKSTIESRL